MSRQAAAQGHSAATLNVSRAADGMNAENTVNTAKVENPAKPEDPADTSDTSGNRCFVCEPVQTMNQKVEEWCEQGQLPEMIHLRVCNDHPDDELNRAAKDVASLLNTFSLSPATDFGKVVLRGTFPSRIFLGISS